MIILHANESRRAAALRELGPPPRPPIRIFWETGKEPKGSKKANREYEEQSRKWHERYDAINRGDY